MAATVTRKGQVTIPKRLHERLGITPGSSAQFERSPNGRVAMFKVEGAPSMPNFEHLRGLLPEGQARMTCCG